MAAPLLALSLAAPAASASGHGTADTIAPAPAAGGGTAPSSVPLERQVLPPGDGWASLDGGTTGGADAAPEDVIDVRTRDELVAAVQGDHPKIVRVVGDIDANTAADGSPLTCEDYARDGYTLEGYLDAFDPAHWDGPASGPLEVARKASSAAQGQQIRVRLGSNTTLIGAGDVTLSGFVVEVGDVDNVIVRNLRISDAYDCFPVWDGGTWKTEWDNLVVSGGTHVWLDHLTLDDGETVDTEQPEYFGERFLRHDGLLDVVRGADLVTISWSRLVGHDKSMLFGNGDDRTSDRGKLRVTMHHNELVDLVQRAPRVRFGQVHVYDNVYRVTDPARYGYSWGVGVESSITARENTFELADGVDPSRIIHDWGGTGIDIDGTWVNGAEVDVLAAYNTAHPDRPLAEDVAGEAGPHGVIQPAAVAAPAVAEGAGSGKLEHWQDPTDPAVAGAALLRSIKAPRTTTADGPVWSPVATGFASTTTEQRPQGTTGGAGGRTVTASDAAALARYAAADEPLTILVEGTLRIEPLGSMIKVAGDKTIAGVGPRAAIEGGGLFLDRVENVIVRNLTFRDSYVPGDWDGKDNDHDGIRIDTSSHVWIDHNEFTRLGDGLVDVRKDSTAVTLSWNVFRDHNKAIGVGWTPNVVTTLTMHHNWFSNIYQRNGSIDNVAAGHLYNNLVEGHGQYGTMSRGASQLVVEHSVYRHGEDAIVAKDPESRVHSRDNRFDSVRGRKDNTGPTFDPAAYYAYAPDPTAEVTALVTAQAGPRGKTEKVGKRVTVALDGTGDYASISAAVGAAWRADHPVEIVVEPGAYREVVRVWPGTEGLTIRGSTGNPEDVVLTYDLAAGQEKFYGGVFGATGAATLAILADDVTVQDITVENAYDEAANGASQAQALRTVGDRIVLDGVRLLGNQDTYLAETPALGVVSRVYVSDSYIEGDVDFIYARATVVLEDSQIHSLDRGMAVNGYVAAPATAPGTNGFLFTDCRFTSDAAAGTVFLGRPWHPSSNPDVEPSVVVRDSWLDEHVRTPAWSDMGGWPWQEDFLREHSNTGPGAAPAGEEVEGRPQLTDEEAAVHTREAYLTGDDGWTPWTEQR
ncbi:pectinesterase family protein [Isoptericola croceus]|uniref:pectinesterase family protein n=1 Tax=Isoptericola croceus TaxID=3031406 RepID=UPI0023F6678B|nr:pectinesterase family protein [Isoptericola croceus]